MIKTILILLILTGLTIAQEVNQVVIDEKSDKPMLIGATTPEAFTDSAFVWWWNSEQEMYEVDSELLPAIEERMDNVEIVIIMGTWCSDSRTQVPRFFKILEEVNYDIHTVKIINVDREKKDPEGLAEAFVPELIPTFYILRNQSELGSIVETPQESLEADLLNILKN